MGKEWGETRKCEREERGRERMVESLDLKRNAADTSSQFRDQSCNHTRIHVFRGDQKIHLFISQSIKMNNIQA
jgi:hypothetical protein